MLGARYMMRRDLWAFTPFTAVTFPARDYVVLAHAAQGLGLNMLEVGVTVGRVLTSDGAAKGYLQGTYGYSFSESPYEEFRSIAAAPRWRRATSSAVSPCRGSRTGVASTVASHGRISAPSTTPITLQGHDQAAATREWRYAAGVSFQLSDVMSLEMSYGDLLWGANTHDARALSVGWTWGFQAFGGRKLGDGFK